jgi:hypothetical protein
MLQCFAKAESDEEQTYRQLFCDVTGESGCMVASFVRARYGFVGLLDDGF